MTGYKVYRNGTQIATATTTSYSNTGLTASTAYTYTISAYDAAGNVSGQSVTASATTQAKATGKLIFSFRW
jgi:chitodextrinase